MNLQGRGHSDEVHVGYWKTTTERRLSLFMTDVAIFYVAMLGIVTNHMLFYICWKTVEWVCGYFFCYATLCFIDYFR